MRTQWMVGLTVARLALARTKACRPALPARRTGLKHFLLLAVLGLLLAAAPNASAVYQIAQVAIVSPTPGQVVTNQILAAAGSVTRFSTSVAVSNLWYQLNGGGWTAVASANGWTNWTAGTIADVLTPGSNTLSAYLVDINGNVSATNMVTFDYVVTAGAQFAGPPGTPAAGFNDPGGQHDVVLIGGGIGAQPITNGIGQFNAGATAFAGDVVFLRNPNGGNNPTNWAAVLRFVNPADPTGTNGLAATEYETFFPTNAGPGYFAGFSLLPNVDYVPIASTNADGSITADAVVFGPVGAILAGQEATIVYTAAIQPAAVQFAGPPGTPVASFNNLGGQSIVVTVGGGIGVQPISNSFISLFSSNATTFAGDAVFLRDPNGGNNPTNWAAVLRFVNPSDPTGTNGLVATEYETYFQTNAGPNTFAGFSLLPNVDYLPIGSTNVNGGITADAVVFGPVGAILAGQEATIVYTASIQPAAVQFAGPPGTPATGWGDPGGQLVIVPVGGGIGVQPITTFYGAFNAFAGDVVFLINTNNGTNPTNWAAVLRFVNPGDPTGTNGLAATEYETFFPTNAGPNTFAGFSLLPNVDYLPIASTNANGSIEASTDVFGPVGAIPGGQEAIIAYTASIQPSAGADLSLSAVPGTGPITVGASQAYYLTVSNAGPAAATSVVISNQLPANETFYSVTGGGTTNNGVLLVNLGTLAAGAGTNLTLVVYPTLPPGQVTGQLTNQFQVSANETDPVLTNNSATVVTTVNLPLPGTTLTYTGSNPGEATFVANGTVFGTGPVNENVPATPPNYAYYALTATPGDLILLTDPTGGNSPTNWAAVVRFFNPNDLTGTNGLPATYQEAFFPSDFGSQGFAGFQLFPNTYFTPAGSLSTINGVTSLVATYSEFGPAGVILAGQMEIMLLTVHSSFTDLSLSASAAPEPVTVGSNLVYTLTVSNAPDVLQAPDTVTATGVVVSNAIPANCTFVSATGGAMPTNGVLLINLGSLAEGTNTSVQVVVQPTAAGSLTNTFQVFANEVDPVLTNNTATVVSTVTNAALVFQGIPGTPLSVSNWPSSITSVPIDVFGLFEFGGDAQPFQESVDGSFSTANTVVAGDIVVLIDPSGGNNPTNWAGVMEFFNPGDPTGTIGLAATEQQVFLPANVGPGGFASFALFPNVDYVPASSISIQQIDAVYTEYGPAGGILAGQTAFFELFMSLPPETNTVTITSPTAGQQVNSALFTVTGTASDNLAAVTNVLVQLNGGNWTNATTVNGWTNWTANVTLTPGSNTVSAYAVDGYGSFSPTNSVTFDYSTGGSPQADLSLSASAAPEPVGVNSNLVYSIVITNQGPNVASGVTVSNRIPVGVNFVSATGGATPTNGVLLVNLGSLTNGAVTNVQVIVQPTTAGKLTNFFQIFADQTDPVLTNNFAAVISTVTNVTVVPPPVDVALSLAAAPNPVSVGAPLTYSLTVTNNSSTPATGVVVSNTLPPNVTVFSLLPSQGAATNQAGVVTYNLGSLPNGSAATLAIVVIPNAAGLLTNTASVSSLQTDSQPANNLATNVTTAVSVPITNLVLTVLSSITLNPQTGLFEERIEVSNGGPATPSSVLVLISGLAANVKVYNATGTTNGVPYVQSSSPLGIGSNVVFLLEYYVPTRIAPTNLTLTVQAGPIVIPPVVSGTILNISRMIKLDNGSVLVDFSALPGQVYAIQYSSDMVTWLTAVPAITAPANQVQWIDSGPPKTVSSPADQGARYYRVVMLNQPLK